MTSDWFEDGGLAVDFRGCRIWLDGNEVSTSALRFKILSCLIENAGRPVTTQEIIRYAWQDPQYDPSLVKWHIARLRRELADNPPRRIVYVRGFGYRYDLVESHRNGQAHSPNSGAAMHRGRTADSVDAPVPALDEASVPMRSLRCHQIYR